MTSARFDAALKELLNAGAGTQKVDASLEEVLFGGTGTQKFDAIAVEALIPSDSILESATAGDSVSSTATFAASVSESASAGDSISTTGTLVGSLSEAATAGDTVSATASLNATLTETASAGDTVDVTGTLNASLTETASAGDTVDATGTLTASLTETASAGDTIDSTGSSSGDLSDSGTAGDTIDATGTFPVDLTEAATAGDTVSASNGAAGDLGDSASAGDAIDATVTGGGTSTTKAVTDAFLIETQDAVTEPIRTNMVALETLVTGIQVGHIERVFSNSVVVETQTAYIAPPRWPHVNATLLETLYSPGTPLVPIYGLRFWGFKWAYGIYEKLAVWCAGLDLGDWPVDQSGFVGVVPWQCDPDGLFTRDWIANIAANPPEGGFGASAVNIDLHNDDGSFSRYVVDCAIGVPYESRVQVLRPNAPEQNHLTTPSLAVTRRIHQYGIQVTGTQNISVGTAEANLRPADFRRPNGDKYRKADMYTGVHWDTIDANYDYDNMMMVQMFRPYPARIESIIGFLRTYDRND